MSIRGDLPTDHETLLAKFVKARLAIICEWSGTIGRDAKELKRWAEKYARQEGLAVPEADWDVYIHEEDGG